MCSSVWIQTNKLRICAFFSFFSVVLVKAKKKKIKTEETEETETKEAKSEEKDDGHKAYDSSRFLVKLDDEVIKIIADTYWKIANEFTPITGGGIGIGFEAMGGNIIKKDENYKNTSFQNRDSLATFIVGVSWTNTASRGRAYEYLKYFENNIFKKISNVKYVNYMENILGDSTLKQYYPNKKIFEEVRKIKTQYDPKNMFRFELSIPPLEKEW